MSTPWVLSYLLLWLLVVALCAIMVGVLRQVGLLRLSHTPQPEPTDDQGPTADRVGPRLGTHLPAHELETINGMGRVALASALSGQRTLVAFLSPLCEGCQDAVEALNTLADDRSGEIRAIAILMGEHRAWQSFLKVLPLRMPVVGDTSGKLSYEFNVDAVPFGLLYNEEGILIRKAILREAVLKLPTLLGESDYTVGQDVFPPPISTEARSPAGVHALANQGF